MPLPVIFAARQFNPTASLRLPCSCACVPLLRAEKQLSDPSQRIHKVLETARVLYGLIHARYILTAQGLSDMVRARHCSILITPSCIL